MDFIQSINSIVTSIIIPDWTCFDADYTIFDFSRFTQVESIEIGYYCFNKVITFQIDGLNRLKTIQIGRNSFTWNKGKWGFGKSFHILNCESLESIQIGPWSFSDFSGEFELKNLPQLQSIQIGWIGWDSFNFYNTSFVVRGIELILNIWMIRSSKSTIHYNGRMCFYSFLLNNNGKYRMNLNEMIWIDLPSLQSITLGGFPFEGRDIDSCSLIMRSNNEMIENEWI